MYGGPYIPSGGNRHQVVHRPPAAPFLRGVFGDARLSHLTVEDGAQITRQSSSFFSARQMSASHILCEVFSVKSRLFSIIGIASLAVLAASTGVITSQETGKGQATMTQTPERSVTAIDTVLEPDATMIERATADNARLLKNFPKGYTLGGSHAPVWVGI